jgi:hypothetical protein
LVDRHELCDDAASTLDNLAIVPASLLPFRGQWQAMANRLPDGATLIILPPADTPSRRILDKVVALLQARGQRVTTLLTEQFAYCKPNNSGYPGRTGRFE